MIDARNEKHTVRRVFYQDFKKHLKKIESEYNNFGMHINVWNQKLLAYIDFRARG